MAAFKIVMTEVGDPLLDKVHRNRIADIGQFFERVVNVVTENLAIARTNVKILKSF